MSSGVTHSTFDKYWDDLKKHDKRLNHWLPRLKEAFERLGGQRPLRYFTLCARTMIDVFMLVNEGILQFDQESQSIQGIHFCECKSDDYTEIKDLIAREDSGFLGDLERIVLFEDDAFTGRYPTDQSIEEALAEEDVASSDRGDLLRLKQVHNNFVSAFPYDCINLDFCGAFYKPPDILDINKTIKKVLEWQRNGSKDGSASVEEFTMAITCRQDQSLHQNAKDRLLALVKANCASSAEYDKQVRESSGGLGVDQWLKTNVQDFFMAAWPKDVAHIAKELHWETDILDYVYYTRPIKNGEPYLMICLIARFTRKAASPDYINAALYALDANNRKLISDLQPRSPERVALRGSLVDIVTSRNEQAQRVNREDLLPEPHD